MANLVPLSKSQIVKYQKTQSFDKSKFFNFNKKVESKKTNVKPNEKSQKLLESTLSKIERKVITIDKLLKDSFALKQKQTKVASKEKEEKTFKEKEKELEKTKPKKAKGVNLPSKPKLGLFDWIKNFIFNTILGYFTIKFFDYLPKLLKLLPTIIKTGEFIIDFAGGILDSLVTLVDLGYKAYDATRGFLKTIGGENIAKTFDDISSKLNTFLNLAVLAGMAVVGSGYKAAGAVAGKAAGATARAGVTASVRGALASLKPVLSKLPIIGGLVEFVLSWALGDPVGRAAFKGIGSALLGAIGTAIGGPIGLFIGQWAGAEGGGILYDILFGNKKPTTGRKYAGGGSTKKGGPNTKRTLRKTKKARKLTVSPRKIKPGVSAGGEKRIQALFPDTEKTGGTFGFLGGLFGGKKEDSQLKKSTEKFANPQEFLTRSNDVLAKANFFGPLFTVALKSILGQRPDKLDYENVGYGLNAWMQQTFKTGSLGFSGGGEVDARQFFAGEDYSKVIAKSVEDSVSSEVNDTIRNLSRELTLRPVGREEMIRKNNERSQPTTEDGLEVGPAGSSGDKLTMARNLMRDLGLTAAQAAGIVGNMAAESGVENARPQGSRPGTKAPLKVDGVTGYGLVQWTSKGRQQALADFARSRGADLSKPLSMDIEYQFFLKEFRGAYGHVLKQIKSAPDVKTASTIFMQQYEIPAGYKTNTKIMERYNMSKPIYDRLAKGEGKATEGKGTYIAPSSSGAGGVIGGSGKFVQGNSGNSRGVHFHIGPGNQTKGTILQSKYNADARASAAKVVDYFLKRGSSIYDGRRGVYFKSSKEVAEAQRAHSASGSQGGIDLQVDFEKPHPFPLRTLGMAFRPNGFGVSADIAGSNSFVAHGRYDERGKKAPQTGGLIAYQRGGPTLDGPHMAMIGEKGREYVIDADSYEETEKVAPGLLDILNYNVKDTASLQKNMPLIISSLSQYTNYELPYGGESQIIEVPVEVPIEVPIPIGGGVGGGGGVNSNDTFDRLAIG